MNEYRVQELHNGEWIGTGNTFSTPEEAAGMIEWYQRNAAEGGRLVLEFRVVWREIGEWRPL